MVLVTEASVERGPAPARWSSGRGNADVSPIRVGIVNIMPRAETYEPYLLRPLNRVLLPVQPVWIRLASHQYASSDAARISSRYVTFEQALGSGPLDALVLTGAPVEELAFEQVHYWSELSEILHFCGRSLASTLGLCWGGLALAKLLDLEKRAFPKKLFGVFQNQHLAPEHVITGGSDDLFWCAQSRHSGVPDRELEAARDAGVVSLLSYGVDTGYTVFESTDHKYVMHLGHPEYEPARLVHEWERDASLGRADVDPPRNFDVRRPHNNWRSHCNELFSQWLRYVDGTRGAAP